MKENIPIEEEIPKIKEGSSRNKASKENQSLRSQILALRERQRALVNFPSFSLSLVCVSVRERVCVGFI